MAVYLVSNTAELNSALSNATGGDRIELQSGDYGDIKIQQLNFSAEVVIAAHDPDAPPNINTISIFESSNISLDGINLDFTPTTATVDWTSALRISSSENIAIRNSTITGGDAIAGIDPDAPAGSQGAGGINGFPIGYGISAFNSSGISIENNRISEFRTGITFNSVDGIQINDNEIFDVRTTPINGADVSNVHMEGNYLHDVTPWKFGGAGDHGDFVHFWTESDQTEASSNLTFLNNTFSQGSGVAILGIFLEDNASRIGYQNVVIHNNVMYNGNAQGLTLESVDGLVISNNSLLQVSGGQNNAPGILLLNNTENVSIHSNILSGISGGAFLNAGTNNITEHSNLYVKSLDSTGASQYNNIFISSSLEAVDGQYGFILLPGSAADLANIGASATQPESEAGLTLAQFHVNGVVNDGASRVFDARFGLPEGTLYHWDFGDGTSATGPLLLHSFTGGGRYEVVLTVTLPDGQTSAATLALGVDGPDVIKLAPSGGFLAYDYGTPTALAIPTSGSSDGIQLSATGVAATVSLTHVVEIARSNEIEIDLSLKADSVGTAGEVFRLHGSFMAKITSTGNLAFTTYSKTGSPTTVTSTGINLADGAEHYVWIRIADGKILLTVDDLPAVQVNFVGPLGWTGSHGLSFGNPWGSANFVGDVSTFRIRTDVTDYPTTPDTVVIDDPTLPPQGGRVLIGGTGDDIYIIEYVTDVVQDTGGIDEARSGTLSIDLRTSGLSDIENAALVGSANLDLAGDEQDNRLIGNAGDNRLDGGAGADTLEGGGGIDTMRGGLGDDSYVIDGDDIIFESADEGHDTVRSSVSYTLAANLETLILTGTAAIDGTGNAKVNLLVGNDMANTLEGGGGPDTMQGGLGNDTYIVRGNDILIENADGGHDTVKSSVSYTLAANLETLILIDTALDGTGNAGANLLVGNDMANTLEGGGGIDTLRGGLGDDSYVIDGDDILIESADEGHDTVRSSVSYTLAAHLETLILTGTALNGTGNAKVNLLVGNDMANTLEGGGGPDTMQGGLGNDTYIVRGRDILIENADEGHDTVQSSVSHTLAANLETLTLIGTEAIDGTGNAGANLLVGNDMANTLEGGGGIDTLRGGLGDDSYVIDGSDVILENAGEGWDTVKSSVSYTLKVNFETLILTGSEALTGIGNKQDNILIGNEAANALHGGEGRDTLTGGGGSDTFVFSSRSGADLVTDFNAIGSNHDVLNLRNVRSITSFNDLLSNHATQVEGGVIIDAGKGDTIMLQGVQLSDLDTGDFLF